MASLDKSRKSSVSSHKVLEWTWPDSRSMGSSSSVQSCEPCGSELRLPASKLHFTSERLRALTPLLDSLVEASDARQMSSELENTLEGLVQRLVDGAGEKDPRFRCQHLIALHREKRLRSRSLEYLVPLDAFPALNSGDDECCLQEGPAGYARIKLSGRLADQWQEYLTPAGYLWRAAVVERWVGLVCAGATDARRHTPRGAARVLGVRAATNATPYEYCYLEKAGGYGGGGGSDYRLAIVEGATWVSVRVRAGAAEAEARLALAVRGAGGAALAAHPQRVPLAHPLALLHYAAANTGFYATAACPPAAASCPERAATWQLWHPALEAELDAQHAERGGVARIAAALNAVLDHLRDGHVKPGLRVLSRYAVSCELRRRLERCCAAPTAATRAVLAAHAPHHVLAVLDRLVMLCAARRCAGYVYDTPCLARGGVRCSEADWRSDATCIANFLTQLHADSAKAEEIPTSPAETLEVVLFRRWETILREMRATTAAGAGGSPLYSSRQLLYVARVCSELVRYKKNVAQDKQSVFKTNLLNATTQNQEPVEDLIHILAIMLEHARDQYLANFKQTKQENANSDHHQEHLCYRSKRISKLKDYYDISSACLIDAVRRDPDVRKEDLTEDTNKIKHIISWLHKGMKDDKKYLGPVLKPFLEALYASSHENCWFLDDYDAKKLKKEHQGLKLYCLGVHNGSVDPSLGLLDAAKKYAWAKALVDFIDRSKHSGVKLVFPGAAGDEGRRARVRLVSRREDARARCVTLTRQDKTDAKRTLATRCVLGAFAAAFGGESTHVKIPGPTDYPTISRSEEFLPSAASGQYWRNSTKPDIVTSNAPLDGTLPRDKPGGPSDPTSTLKRESRQGRPRKERPATAYGYPDIPINISRDNALTMRKKYHTLKSLVYSDSVESMRELRERPRSAGNSMKVKEPMSRPTILETMDFINGVREALYVEESGASDAEEAGGEEGALLREVSPLNLLARLARADSPHHTLGNVVAALLAMGKFTVLQELSAWLGEGRAGALFALHRLARAARTRTLSADRRASRRSIERAPHDRSQSPPQRYRPRPPDYFSGDEAPPPPPPPRPAVSQTDRSRPRYPDYSPPRRHRAYDRSPAGEPPSLPALAPYSRGANADYTGIINPIYDERKIEKFSNKRSKSLGRSFSGRNAVLEAARYNVTLGPRAGRRTNDVVAVLMGPTAETGLDYKGAYHHKYGTSGVVGDSYKLSRVAID